MMRVSVNVLFVFAVAVASQEGAESSVPINATTGHRLLQAADIQHLARRRLVKRPLVRNDRQLLASMRQHGRSELARATQEDLQDLRDLQGAQGRPLRDGASAGPSSNASAQGHASSSPTSTPIAPGRTGASGSWVTGALGFSGASSPKVAAVSPRAAAAGSFLLKGAQGAASIHKAMAEERRELVRAALDVGIPVDGDPNVAASTNRTARSLARINAALARIDAASSSLEPLEEAVYARKPQYREAKDAWRHIKMARRHQWNPKSSQSRGMARFWSSAVFFEWVIFFTALPCFVMLHYHLIEWPSTKAYHASALLIWLLVAALYGTVIWLRLGTDAGITWATGYILEFIFSIENIFVFHIVVTAFKTPRKLTQRALFIVICCQAAFQMVFYMGLAHWLRSLQVLPYILGVWLLYVGIESAREENHANINIKDTLWYRFFSRVFGNRLSPEYEEDGRFVFAVKGRFYVSLLAVVTACLLTVDFLLEIDVTLTKIEELDNEYLAFTSSVVAAFAAPELFFVARDLFQRFHLLKFGVSFVLIFFGMQMVCHKFFTMPELLGCGIIVVVMICCIIASHASKYKFPGSAHEHMNRQLSDN